MILLAVIDFGRIIYEKNRLESAAGDAVDLISNGVLTDEQIERQLKNTYKMNLTLSVERKPVNTIIKITCGVDVITPGLGTVLPNPFVIDTSRVVDNG